MGTSHCDVKKVRVTHFLNIIVRAAKECPTPR